MAVRTADRTPDDTSDGTSDGEEEEYTAPSRVAGRYMTSCPVCKRSVQLKTLRYTHQCGRTFDARKRAQEQQKSAFDAIKARTAYKVAETLEIERKTERKMERSMELRTAPTALADKAARYSKLLNF